MRSMIKTFLISWVLVVCAGCLVAVKTANADYHDPTAKTNVNEQTDLFDQSIDDWSGLQDQIRDSKETTINGAKSEEGLDYLVKESKSEITTEADSLSSINANDLQDKGTNKMLQENTINDLYVDFDKPLNKQYMVDAQKIANAQDELIKNLQAVLKDFGVDCKTAKGPKEIEPAYYLQIKKEQTKDTVYNKTLCEELRNKYNCTDELKVKCTRTGPRYGEWQYKTIRFGGAELHNTKADWGFAIKRCRKEWDWFITPNHPKRGVFGYGDNKQVDSIWRDNPAAIVADARVFIAGKVGAGLDQIREDIVFPPEGRGIGNQFWGVGRWRHPWEEYEFGYWYRDIYQVCELWDEDWSEECKLQ